MEKLKKTDDLKMLRKHLREADAGSPVVEVCGGSACRASGSAKVVKAMKEESLMKGLDLEGEK